MCGAREGGVGALFVAVVAGVDHAPGAEYHANARGGEVAGEDGHCSHEETRHSNAKLELLPQGPIGPI